MENQKTEVVEYGLLLPNGQVLWNNYNERSLETPAERLEMVQVLRKTAQECGFHEDDFTSNYKWIHRKVEVTVLGIFPLGDPSVIEVDSSDGGEDSVLDDTNNTTEATEGLQPAYSNS